MPLQEQCPDCLGKGKIELLIHYEDPCQTCKGSGKVLAQQQPKPRYTTTGVSLEEKTEDPDDMKGTSLEGLAYHQIPSRY